MQIPIAKQTPYLKGIAQLLLPLTNAWTKYFSWKILIAGLGHKTDTAFVGIVLIAVNVDANHMGMISCMYFNDSV